MCSSDLEARHAIDGPGNMSAWKVKAAPFIVSMKSESIAAVNMKINYEPLTIDPATFFHTSHSEALQVVASNGGIHFDIKLVSLRYEHKTKASYKAQLAEEAVAKGLSRKEPAKAPPNKKLRVHKTDDSDQVAKPEMVQLFRELCPFERQRALAALQRSSAVKAARQAQKVEEADQAENMAKFQRGELPMDSDAYKDCVRRVQRNDEDEKIAKLVKHILR